MNVLAPRLRNARRHPLSVAMAAAEWTAAAACAVALARLFWIAVTPLGPLGDWRGARPQVAGAPAALASIDPFFRASPAAAHATVSSLDLMLVGTRVDIASGRGGAIIALPDGTQQSFAVGDTVQPGVTLLAVDFDSATLRNGGSEEKLFLDQSGGPPPVTPAPERPQ